ncbi:hypothetical protein M758_2G051000 [Ceratodon purpureus]|uniref:Uncharacterized protein n=1 Tax=Ceratodon purpureus TaxID=3225 RepID=A0A8T0IUA8_CERPU|nr:hypothetical protein KC19_2G052000 [Ceratodon purpureus]KAG0625386.1 hypothetical protein M758_2G051000 [Ceratodon purpureus]
MTLQFIYISFVFITLSSSTRKGYVGASRGQLECIHTLVANMLLRCHIMCTICCCGG